MSPEGILLVDKKEGVSSFSLIPLLRKKLGIKKIGHAGTLDPFATGLMILLIGREYTRRSEEFVQSNKEYVAEVMLGSSTDTYDRTGTVLSSSFFVPSLQEVEAALTQFQGEILQVPPMYSAKKQGGKRLYALARQGKEVERPAARVCVETTLLSYAYPRLRLNIRCSKGTYIRSIAHDLGQLLTCGAHVAELRRTKSGTLLVEDAVPQTTLEQEASLLDALRGKFASSFRKTTID